MQKTFKNTIQLSLNELKSFVLLFSIFILISSFSSKSITNESLIIEEGKASYYCAKFVGRKTASGEIFTTNQYTCAHKTLPFGTLIKVTNLENGESIIVKVNDRGPFVKGRVIDLSLQGAKDLGLIGRGVGNVSIEQINQQYSFVGNIRNMEKIAIEGSYAYVPIDQFELLDMLYALIFQNEDAPKNQSL